MELINWLWLAIIRPVFLAISQAAEWITSHWITGAVAAGVLMIIGVALRFWVRKGNK